MRVKILPYNTKNLEKIMGLPKIYMVGIWVKAGVRDYHWTGKFTKNGQPLVWQYNDHNGTADQFELVPLDRVTTGQVVAWFRTEGEANLIANALNQYFKWEE